MNTTQVSIDELRSNLADIIGRVMYGESQIVVKKYNREAAVIISKEEYERLKDPTKRLSKEQWNEKFRTIGKIKTKIPDINPREFDRVINEAIRDVRLAKQAKQTK